VGFAELLLCGFYRGFPAALPLGALEFGLKRLLVGECGAKLNFLQDLRQQVLELACARTSTALLVIRGRSCYPVGSSQT